MRIQIALDSGKLAVTIHDNGKGFAKSSAASQEPNISAGGQKDGLYNMRQRMENISGQLELASTPAGGTRVKLIIDLGQMPKADGRPILNPLKL